MWVFTTIGFFSIVAHRDRLGSVLVRARDKADLTALVRLLPAPRPNVRVTPTADYPFRAVVDKQAMARVMATLTEGIDYDNFKNAVAVRQGEERARVYHEVWAALLPLGVALPESEADAKSWRWIREHMSPGAIARFRDGAINHGITSEPGETDGGREKPKPSKRSR